jgi:hypothetical protein
MVVVIVVVIIMVVVGHGVANGGSAHAANNRSDWSPDDGSTNGAGNASRHCPA